MSGSNRLNCKHRSRGVWLVKVPKYLSSKWLNTSGPREIGKIRVTKPSSASGRSDVKFCLNESLARESGSSDLPMEHQFLTSGLNYQTMMVICEDKTECDEPKNEVGNLSVIGKVVQKAECRPPPNNKYLQMKINHIENVSKPEKVIKTMERAEVKFKPKSSSTEAFDDRSKKSEKIRLSRDSLVELLFQSFEKHQYYRLIDLAKITQQPLGYLKEVLSEIAQYNTMPPHRYTWELKPEYRHYDSNSASGTQ